MNKNKVNLFIVIFSISFSTFLAVFLLLTRLISIDVKSNSNITYEKDWKVDHLFQQVFYDRIVWDISCLNIHLRSVDSLNPQKRRGFTYIQWFVYQMKSFFKTRKIYEYSLWNCCFKILLSCVHSLQSNKLDCHECWFNASNDSKEDTNFNSLIQDTLQFHTLHLVKVLRGNPDHTSLGAGTDDYDHTHLGMVRVT